MNKGGRGEFTREISGLGPELGNLSKGSEGIKEKKKKHHYNLIIIIIKN